jgi:hypothetical protein
MEKFGERDLIPASKIEGSRWAKADCVALSLVEEDKENNVQLTLTGDEFLSTPMSRQRMFRDFLMHLAYINPYLAQIEDSSRSHLQVLKKHPWGYGVY